MKAPISLSQQDAFAPLRACKGAVSLKVDHAKLDSQSLVHFRACKGAVPLKVAASLARKERALISAPEGAVLLKDRGRVAALLAVLSLRA